MTVDKILRPDPGLVFAGTQPQPGPVPNFRLGRGWPQTERLVR
jgi:hypothetical protein